MADKSKCSAPRAGFNRAHLRREAACHPSNIQDDVGRAHLRRVLGVMFPPAYIKLFHQPPHSVCSLFSLRLCPPSQQSNFETRPAARDQQQQQRQQQQQHVAGDEAKRADAPRCEPSSEPSSRAQIIHLQNCLQESLIEHQAKPVGLCPIRRAIYEQCFDELIRQVTVGCIEQGLLLFRIRNEFRMTIGCYRRAYESAVRYGLNKAIDASLKLNQMKLEREAQTEIHNHSRCDTINSKIENADHNGAPELARLESKLKEYYEGELASKDEVIAQQRAIIKAFNQKS